MPENSVKSALLLFEIDRLTLAKLGLKSDDIDRLYRILYVTSEGFFQTIEDITSHKKSTGVLIRIWKAFQTLLQSTC
jgi:hypothetical protein